MGKILLVTNKTWHDQLYKNLSSDKHHLECLRVTDREKFTFELCQSFSPDWIFIPHWSHLIPKEIFTNYKCVVFHMTDLPYGRGGSPLQNLIVRGHEETKISAINVTSEIDAGKIYLKRHLNLNGTSEEIFIRSSKVIEEMIDTIISERPKPKEQKGDIVKFSRRKPEDGDISNLKSLKDVYDFIRMLDCEGYPKAFLETDEFTFEFSRASLKADESIKADVRISKK